MSAVIVTVELVFERAQEIYGGAMLLCHRNIIKIVLLQTRKKLFFKRDSSATPGHLVFLVLCCTLPFAPGYFPSLHRRGIWQTEHRR